jgi:deazaflavin-dependent oxidoreductase (nitroreductase family)
MMETIWKVHLWAYQKTGGRIGGTMMGMPVLLLRTKGRKTGAERSNALMYVPHGEACVVIASNAGEPRHPGWWHNLKANPRAEIQRGRQRTAVVAREAEGEERARLWAEVLAHEKSYAEYEARTTRRIPIVVLEPVRG